MRTKTLCIAVPAVAMAIAAGNFHAAQNAAGCPPPKNPCSCVVATLGGIQGFKSNTERKPSCSVQKSLFGFDWWSELKPCEELSAESDNRIVTCDKGFKAVLNCGTSGQQTTVVVSGGTRTLKCGKDTFKLPVIVADTLRTGPARKTGSTKNYGLDETLGALRRTEAEGGATYVARTAVLHVPEDAEAAIENDSEDRQRLVVAAGTVTVESLCTGQVFTTSSPAIVTLPLMDMSGIYSGVALSDMPSCEVKDYTGRWRGMYSRNADDPSDRGVAFTLNIRKSPEEASIELPEGILTVSEMRTVGELYVAASRQDDSGLREIIVTGFATKGEATLQVTETWTAAGETSTWESLAWAERLHIAQNALPEAVLNVPYEAALIAMSPKSGDITFRLAEGQLPAGIALDETTGALSGTAVEAGSFKFAVEAVDASGETFRQPLTLQVKKIALVTLLPDGFSGKTYKTTLQARGGTPPYTWSNQFPFSLTPGLKLDPATGEVTYTPADSDASGLALMIEVRDSAGNTDEALLMAVLRKVTILGSNFLPDGTVGSFYIHKFETAGNSQPVKWRIDPDPTPVGLTFDEDTGEISGTPNRRTTVLVTVTAEDEEESASREFMLQLDGPDAGTEESAQARRAAAACRSCGR